MSHGSKLLFGKFYGCGRNLKQIYAILYVQNEMFNTPSQQRISSMAVENLPVFNSVSKDKLMNIATQVYSSYHLFSDIFV